MAAGGTGGPWGGGQPQDAAALTVTAPSWQSELARNGQVALAKPVISIGSDPACDVAIFDPGVAPRHAVIRAVQGGYAIEDLGSATGTWVEGRRVAPATPAPLAPGQHVRIGGADLALVAVVTGEAGTIVASGPERTVRAGAQQAQPSATPGAGGPAAPAMPPYAAAAPAPSGPQYAAAAAIPATPAPHMQPQPQYAAPATPPSFGAPQPAAPVAPVAVMAPAVPVTPPIAGPQQPYGNLGASQARFDFNVWLQAQKPRLYWKFFLIGLGVLILAEMVANSTQNTNMVPLILLVYSALVPVTFVIYCWEQGAEAAQMPPIFIAIAFGLGATFGLILGGLIESAFNVDLSNLFSALLVGTAEETAKAAAVIYFLRDRRLSRELHGLLLGAASGMGFAALETAGYGFGAFLAGAQQIGTFGGAMYAVNNQLLGRMVLAVFGHGVWTAILCAAIWRERGGQSFAVTRGIIIAFCIAVGLHGMWDFSIGQGWAVINLGDLALPGFDVFIVGPLGLLILGFFLREAVERARTGDALPPPPLDVALKAYFSALWQRVSGGNRPFVVASQPYPGAPAPYGAQQPQAYTPQPQAPMFPAQQQPQPAPYQPAQPPAFQSAQYRPPAAPDPTIQMPAAPPTIGGMIPVAPVTPPIQPATPLPTPAFGSPQIQGAPPSETPLPPTVPYCPRCGISYEPGATFCGQCGSRLGEAISGA